MNPTTTRRLTVTDTAKLLRQALKAAHPGTKFSVRSDKYAGGASIHVRWTDGPTVEQVRETSQLYRGATFDGMTDSKTYLTSLVAFDDEVVEVRFGADFVFEHRDVSEAMIERLVMHTRPTMLGASWAVNRGECCSCRRYLSPGGAWVGEHEHLVGCSPRCVAKKMADTTNVEV